MFGLSLSCAALIGVVGKAASPPVKFITALWRGWLLSIGFFIFTMCVPTPLIFACVGFSAVSVQKIYFGDPLRS